MAPSLNETLRALPAVEAVLNTTELLPFAQRLPHSVVADAARNAVAHVRQEILAGNTPETSAESIARLAAASLAYASKPNLRPVVNATGVVIHTNIGRSILAEEAVKAVVDVAENYSTLEYSTQDMARGSRHSHCEELLCALTGAEAAIAVNNNAAAVMMVLAEFARGREAVISRGELIEIGGSFRIPDIMDYSNAHMREVGTTNKTHLSDYERAITPETALLLKVHTSNYRLIGFTESVSIKELKKLADQNNAQSENQILVYEDLGSGVLLNAYPFDAEAEPTVAHSVKEGADLVSFSGDKLLGGPQAGIIVGSKKHIDRLKKNPLARALRLDKMTLAALEATLRLYLDPERALERIPTLRMLHMSAENARAEAQALAEAIGKAVPASCGTLEVIDETARAGGGSLPMHDIPSAAVRLTFAQGNAQGCETFLIQECDAPILARIKKEALLFDARTLKRNQHEYIASSLARYFETL